jgi:hypothetical protein
MNLMMNHSVDKNNCAARAQAPTKARIWDPLVRELDQKDKFIAELKQTLAHTRICAETARAALESMNDDNEKGGSAQDRASLCEAALNNLRKI